MTKPIMQKYKEEVEKVKRAIKEIKDSGKASLERKLWDIYSYLREIINSRDVTKKDKKITEIGYRPLHFDEWWKNEKEKDYPKIERM